MSKLILSAFLICLIITPSLCMQQHTSKLSNASKKSIDKLRANKGTWASFMLDLAEVHLASGGPLDELTEAIEGVISDLAVKLEQAHANFDERTAQNEAEEQRINTLIDSAGADIASTVEFLAVLETQRVAFVGEIENLERAITNNVQITEDSVNLRALQNGVYLAKIPEHKMAIEALNEALEVLSQLTGAGASFLQVKSLKANVEKIQKSLKKGADKAYLTALMDLAEKSKFADAGAVERVAQIMRDVRDNLTASLLQITEEEEANVVAFEAEQARLFAELNALNNDLNVARENLELTEERIVDNQEFLEQRTRDKATSEQDLVDEQESYEADTKVYEDLVAQFNNELSACEAALEHLNASDIADYIGGRMEQDVIIDQAHGAPIAVEATFDEFQ